MAALIPEETATHIAIADGSWFDADTWSSGTVPTSVAIVYIPEGITVDYDESSDENIFAIRVDGNFNCTQTEADEVTSLTFDTFIGTMSSNVNFHADGLTDGRIEVTIKPFNIEAHKAGKSGFPLE